MHSMRPFAAVVLVGALCAQASAPPRGRTKDRTLFELELQRPGKADYAVHEWGTFTSMVGADGIALEGLQREEERLPPFVHDLANVVEWEDAGTKLPSSHVTQKMETPVLYFHSEEPLRVRVHVWFQDGLMTQFYPLPYRITPALAELQMPVDLSQVESSALGWDIDVVPRHAAPPREIPTVAATDPWAFARAVDAAWVRTRTAGTPAEPEAEHYLFYRGIGRWQPRLSLDVLDDDRVRLANGMGGDVPFVAVLRLDGAGGSFALGTPLGAGGEQVVSLAGLPRERDRRLLAGRLGDAVTKALVRTGLALDEARAMVATWSRSWFMKDGARVIYVLPRCEVDAVLPLFLDPAPRELVRTLVGRLEFITPAAQARVEAALVAAAAADAAARAEGEAALAELDRFLEPHLRNVVAHGRVAAARDRARERLATLTR